MEQNNHFLKAVADSKNLSEKPSNETLLLLYSLYKQANEGDNETEAPTNMFDFVAKAKHTAWLELKGTSKEAAANQYITLVEKLKEG
jgi:diazepam-binding inhibitor (GABA receptor modulator, acyl-CoA-binding protein)